MAGHADEALGDSVFPVKTMLSETAYTGAIWDVTAERFIYPASSGDTELRREFIKHPGAVAVVAMNDDQQVLLLQQYRHPVKQKLWEVPAGLLDADDEPMLMAAQRELAEEADLHASSWRTLVDYYTTPGRSSEGIRVFLATGLSVIPEDQRHQREAEEIDMVQQWLDIQTAVDLVFAGELHNPSTVVGILALAAGGQRRSRPAEAAWLPMGSRG